MNFSASGYLGWSSTGLDYDTRDLSLSRRAANVLGIGDGGTSDAIRISSSGRIYGNAVANPTAHGTDAAVRLTNVVTITCTAAHNLCAGQTVTLAGFTMTTDQCNGTFLITTVPTADTFTVASAGADETSITTTGTITVVAQLVLGNAPVSGSTGAVLIPGIGEQSTCIGASVAAQYGDVAIGSSYASGQFSLAAGYAAYSTGGTSIGLGYNSFARITKTINISGLDCARKDDGQTDYWLYYGSRTNIIYGPEVDFLAAPADYTVTVPAGCKAWVEECGWIQTLLTLDGGALTVQPTVRFGITGTLAKLLAAVPTTLLTAAGTRERYTTLLTDVGETTLTAGVTIGGTIAGGGAGIAYKGRPYWVVRVVENE
jgi:hypothetical protein